MIRGRVSSGREIIVPLDIGKGDGRFEAIEAVLDTGYSGSLTLPSYIIGRLGLELISRISVTLEIWPETGGGRAVSYTWGIKK